MQSSLRARAPYRARVLPLLLAAVIALAGMALPIAPAAAVTTPDGSKELLFRKHVDAAHAGWVDGHPDLLVVDGQETRPADEVAIRLAPDADDDGREVSRMIVDEAHSFIGEPGSVVWSAPQDLYWGWPPVWAGLGAGEFPKNIKQDSIRLELTGVDGPGKMEVYRNELEGVVRTLSSTDPKLRTTELYAGAHGHYAWAFTEAGTYDTRWKVHATTVDGEELVSPERTVSWLVGTDEQVGLPRGTYPHVNMTEPVAELPEGWNGDEAPADPAPEQPAPEDPAPEQPAPEQPAPEQPAPEEPAPEEPAPADGECRPIAAGHLDIGAALTSNGVLDTHMTWDSPDGEKLRLTSGQPTLLVPDAARTDIADTGATTALHDALGSALAYQLPEAQDEYLPWPGFSTEKLDYSDLESVAITMDNVVGPKNGQVAVGHYDSRSSAFSVDLSSKDGADKSIVLKDPTHTHRAMFFSQPGEYTVTFTFHAQGKNGGSRYSSFEARFAVGDEAAKASCNGTGEIATPEDPAPEQPAPEDPAPEQPAPENPAPEKPAPADPAPENPNPGEDGEAPASERLILDQGHTDVFNVGQKDGALTLDLTEDVTGEHVHHQPKDVELHVKDAARTQIPEGWPAAGEAWYLPQSQNPDVLWPGWNTLEARGGGIDPSIDIEITDVKGPGEIHLFGTDSFGAMEPVLEKGATHLTAGAVRRQAYPAHTHANWAFTKPGVYTVTARATGTKNGTKVATEPQTYTFTVGDAFRGKADDNTDGSDSGTEGSGGSNSGDNSTGDAAEGTGAGADGSDSAGSAGGSGDGSVSLGGSLPGPAEAVCRPVEEVRAASAEELSAALNGGNTNSGDAGGGAHTVSGSYTVPKSTHVHPNWVFSAPGTYRVTIRQSVKTTNGDTASANSTLTFRVGPGASGISNGHFDFGAQLQGGKLVGSIKDDRSAPPTWVSPSSLTFAVGDAGKAKAPAGIEFVAPAGQDVWMIGSTQVNGVPWLGANSMHDSIVSGTTGELTMELVSVKGPGNVGVFSSGNFGQVVGQKWFSASKGESQAESKPTKPVDPAKADLSKITVTRDQAKPGQVFVEDGKAMVKEVVGRTEAGEPCELVGGAAGQMARTGTDASGFGLVALSLIAFGGGLAILRRRIA